MCANSREHVAISFLAGVPRLPIRPVWRYSVNTTHQIAAQDKMMTAPGHPKTSACNRCKIFACNFLFGCLLVLICLPLRVLPAQAADLSGIGDWQVKAAYLYKFVSYIEWPDHTFAAPDAPIIIGVLDGDTLADALTKIVENRTVNGHTVVVRKVRAADPLSGFNVLFIGAADEAHSGEIIASLKGQPILVVTESEHAFARGSMINFVLVDGRVRFEAAPKAARQNNLTISARLLAAAYRVLAETS